jgi:hypothetical protein
MSSSNVPLEGSVITFTIVPRGSWASTGIEYRVDSLQGERVTLRRTGAIQSGTSDWTWAYAFAEWKVVA